LRALAKYWPTLSPTLSRKIFNASLWQIEAKASKTVRPAMAAPMLSLQRALGERGKRLTVVHRKSSLGVATTAVAPGVEALDINQFVAQLNAR
jgi:hypothetical protein